MTTEKDLLLQHLRDMITPNEIPEPSDKHPLPWSEVSAGNGHYYIYAGNGSHVAHVYCYDRAELDAYEMRMEGMRPPRLEPPKVDPEVAEVAATLRRFSAEWVRKAKDHQDMRKMYAAYALAKMAKLFESQNTFHIEPESQKP